MQGRDFFQLFSEKLVDMEKCHVNLKHVSLHGNLTFASAHTIFQPRAMKQLQEQGMTLEETLKPASKAG